MSSYPGTGSTMTFDLYASGYCVADAAIVNPTVPRKKIRFYAVWAHLWLPQYGHVLVDTGYNRNFHTVTARFPEKLYGWATPTVVEESQTAAALLRSRNVDPADVQYIIISHFHADHVCALKDFPNATFLCSRAAYAEATRLNGSMAVKKGILKKLLPDDFDSRVKLVEDTAVYVAELDGGLTAYSFFENKDVQLVHLPGHARGMMGVLVNLQPQLFFATDAQWDKAAFEADILPSKLIRLFIDSWSDFTETTGKLKAYCAANPQTRLLFTHCPQTLSYISNEL